MPLIIAKLLLCLSFLVSGVTHGSVAIPAHGSIVVPVDHPVANPGPRP